MALRTRSAIPVGTQFSPALFDLFNALKAFVRHSGDKNRLERAFWARPVHKTKTRVPRSRRTASLPLEAAAQYGLLTRRTYEATQLTRDLSRLSRSALTPVFARHILLNLGGLRVVEAAEQMKADGRPITGDTLAMYLSSQGFPVTIHNTAINTLRMWLAQAGVFSQEGWDVDVTAKEKTAGLDDVALAALAGLNKEQRAFVEALCAIDPPGWYPASDVRSLAEATSGLVLPRASAPKEFLDPLAAAGLITYKTKGTRGGKTASLKTTRRFDNSVLRPFANTTLDTLDAALSAYYKKRPADIYRGLSSRNAHTKGQALEAYVVYIMRLLGLRFVGWRKRAQDHTGRAEVDALLAGRFGAVPTRWQVQCKNTPSSRVALEDVAKEIGLVPLTHATHVMVVANCPFTKDAAAYAAEINRQTAVTVFLLDSADFAAVKRSPGVLGTILINKAEATLRQKASWSLWAP
jgi:hypothetical protein